MLPFEIDISLFVLIQQVNSNISSLSVLEAQDDSTEAEECSSFRLNYVRVARAG
jgi:hypothetical protein